MSRTIGVISDTHGLLRPEAVDALRGSELIIHAGDVGGTEILAQLRAVARVVAVRGNVDRGRWAMELAESEVVRFEGFAIHVLHIVSELADSSLSGINAVVYGHSHKPSIEDRNGVLFFNPGSAGPHRFRLPVSVGRISVVDGQLTAQIVELDVPRR